MKIYLASSWKMAKQVKMWQAFLQQHGHKVDAFCSSLNGRFVFDFSEIENYKSMDAISILKNSKVQKSFHEDKKWLDWADVCLLILPAGRSAHLEAGYAKGKGKLLIIWQNEYTKGEFDVMYGLTDLITEDCNEIINLLANRE